MIKKNGEYEGTVINIGANGEGVVKNGNDIIFVPFALTNEKIRYKVLKTSSKGNFGKVIEMIEPSKERVTPACDVFFKCGGCHLQHINYSSQLKIKGENIKNCFKKIANLDVDVKTPIVGNSCYRYRNKLQLPVQFDGEKNIFGFYSENSHRVISIKDCLINPTWTSEIIGVFSSFMEKYNLKGLGVSDFSGDIREITVKEISDCLIITVVGLKKSFLYTKELIEELKHTLKYEFTLFYNFNNSESNVIYGEEFTRLYGKEEYFSDMNGIKYSIGVKSFSQVNTKVCKLLYSEVVNNINYCENLTVFDAYSGAGLMTAMLAKKAKKVIGIEIIDEAVKIADKLMIQNGLDKKVKNYCGKCETILPQLIFNEKKSGNEVTVVLDPPRKGCDYAVIDALIKSYPEKIIYVSCMPSTLARDIGLLTGSLEYIENKIVKSSDNTLRYSIEKIIPFEMFPNTKHVETLVVLRKF